jgi:PAS domain S-box-containing protein
VLIVTPAGERTSRAILDRLAHHYELKDELDASWAARPLELVCEDGLTTLVLEDPGGEPLARLIGAPMEVGAFLRLGIGIAAALAQAHQRGLVHKDLKPRNILVNCADGQARLTGFGIASRLPRERQTIGPPETLAGTLAFMAPEQTGRMNRSIDSRSDLYSLGVTFYQMLTGALPFTASDPMEWVHCHVAQQPMAPSERRGNIPVPISRIVIKLLAKASEDRYQTVAGLGRDLRRCLAEWEAERRIDDFALGQHDTPDRLMIPERLYGREREVETLLAAFERVVENGAPELLLVTGYSGIGKSSVVNELHKALAPRRGLFASGKFDQFKRDIPYSTLAQAFQNLVRPLLSLSDAEILVWRDAFLEALAPNARLITDLIPELKLITGEPPPAPELAPAQARNRFRLVFRRFIGVFAQADHPLALFLDDLQWLDAATLDIVEDLLKGVDLKHLMLIGAYRNNEVDASHPLARKLEGIKEAGGRIATITLAPLAPEHLQELIADALRCDEQRAAPLAQLTHDKTGGNPFFVIQFLLALAEEDLLQFDHDKAQWVWDLERINAKRYTDNVVDLMVGRLHRLPAATQAAVKRIACFGASAAVAALVLGQDVSEEALHSALRAAVEAGLVFRQEGTYRFLHDRVQEAAYALIPEGERTAAHLAIGRRLAAQTSPQAVEESIFEIVGQLNRAATLICSRNERERVAELNLIAGRRAKASTAYASALSHFAIGQALAPDDAWERRRELAFALALHRAECELLTGALSEAEARLADLTVRFASLPELATVTRLQVELFMILGRSDLAVAVGLDYLRRLGVTWSVHPTREEVREEYAQIWRQLDKRPIESLLELRPMTDPVAHGTMEVLTSLVTPALWSDENFRCLVIGRMGNLSLQYGNSDVSCYAYTAVGTVLGPYFGDYKAGFRFGQLGLDLVEQRGMDRFRARVYLAFANLAKPSTPPALTGDLLARRAFDAAQRAGDLTYAAISCNSLITQLLARGEPLADVQREAETGLDFARNARFGLLVDVITAQLEFVRTLRGLTPAFGHFDELGFDEEQFERRVEGEPGLAIAAFLYWIRKLQARALAGDHVAAFAAATKAKRLLWMSPVVFERADYHFYVALALAALCNGATGSESARYREALADHHRQLQEWADNIPENFENRAALIGAEIARLEGRPLDAMDLYERAICSARANGFVHNEALANELAARFYAARGFETIAHAYLQDAYHCYLQWGADGKARQLEEAYPHLRTEGLAAGPISTIATPVDRLDLATVIKVSQTVSSEMVLENLIDTLLRTAIEQAGAERGLLILANGPEQRIAAEAVTTGDTACVQLRDMPAAPAAVPNSVLRYVLRTRESVILDDATRQPAFADDPYIRERGARSILCLPLLNQAKLIGVLYLENNLTPRAFAPSRIAVLKLLASQAAISLESARLYRDLEHREAKIRRLVDANIIGIFVAERDGQIIEANDAFLRIVGYDRDDLIAGRLRRDDLTAPEWRDHTARAAAERSSTGSVQPYEKEYFRKDGSRVPVLLGATSLSENRDQSLVFVLDVTDRKRAEALLAGEKRILEMVAKGESLDQILDSLCRLVEEQASGVLASILLLDGDRLCHGAAPSLPKAYADAIDGTPVGPSAGSCGTAAYRGEPVIVADIATDSLWAEGREVALSHSLRACWSTPVVSSQTKVIGTIAMYYREPRIPSARDQEIVGQITYLAGIAIERNRTMEALRRSEAYLAEAQKLTRTGSWAYNPFSGEANYWSDELFRICGMDPQERPTIAKYLRLVHPEDRDKIKRRIESEGDEKREFDEEYRLVLPGGTVKRIQVIGRPVFNAAGGLVEFVGTTIDVTERRRAEEELRASEARFRTFVDHATDSFMLHGEGGNILDVNRHACESLGYNRDELIGMPLVEIDPSTDEALLKNIGERLNAGEIATFESLHRRKDGTLFPVEVRVREFHQGGSRLTMSLTRDVTERKRAEAEAREREGRYREAQTELAHASRVATMGQLTASIAHEVNQPIAAAVTNASAALRWLSLQRPDIEEARQALNRIVANGNRAGEIIGRIRDLVKKAPPRKEAVAINDAILEVVALTHGEAVKNGVSVRTQLAEDLPVVEGDRVQLQQVILNLIVNAIEAMSGENQAPRNLLISAEKGDPDGVLVAVRDSGPGLAPEFLERLFEAFYTTKANGMGMGLSICRSIIETHGGRLWASANEPQGAVFQFKVPAHPELEF